MFLEDSKCLKDFIYSTSKYCWYCRREFDFDKCLIKVKYRDTIFRTKDHIISKNNGGPNNPINYISCCNDCNNLKGYMDAKEFAIFLGKISTIRDYKNHPLFPYFKLIRNNSWKLYNKTSKLHLKYLKNLNN